MERMNKQQSNYINNRAGEGGVGGVLRIDGNSRASIAKIMALKVSVGMLIEWVGSRLCQQSLALPPARRELSYAKGSFLVRPCLFHFLVLFLSMFFNVLV